MEHLRQPAQFLGKFKESIKCRRDTKKFMRHGEKLRLNRHQPGRPADFLKKIISCIGDKHSRENSYERNTDIELAMNLISTKIPW